MDVKEAAEVPTEHPQWEISDDEEQEKNSGGSDSEFTTDDEDDHSDKEWTWAQSLATLPTRFDGRNGNQEEHEEAVDELSTIA